MSQVKGSRPFDPYPPESDLEEIRQKIAVGLEQAAWGEFFDGETVFREILEELSRE